MKRCSWAEESPLYIAYHDQEWGVPVYDDQKLFEFLVLEGFQAGLSWITVLRKRENFREAFDYFNAQKIASYSENKVSDLLQNEGIIRNRLKIRATIQNARTYLNIQKEYGSFAKYIWQFIDGKPKINTWKQLREIPSQTAESDRMSKDLRQKGFSFVGSTICYAFMQAVGMVNDHLIDCFRHGQLK